MPQVWTSRAPGRICLFGEHQDYLGLPVIAMAIDRYITITGRKRTDRGVRLHLKDFNQYEEFSIDHIVYEHSRDYLKSVVSILTREGIEIDTGVDCEITGNIPIQAGTSSSSALIVAWAAFLLGLFDESRLDDRAFIGDISYRAEVVEFNESGGWMDQYTSAFGNLVHIDARKDNKIEVLPANLGGFVLGDSGEPKDTIGILTRVKQGVLRAVETLQKNNPGFNINTISYEEAETAVSGLSPDEKRLVLGNIIDRDILNEGLSLLRNKTIDDTRFGRLLDRHNEVLASDKKISTPKIERMLDFSRKAGALGGKINGSGGGGCMFAYAPGRQEVVAEAITRAGGTPHIISPSPGVCFYQNEEYHEE